MHDIGVFYMLEHINMTLKNLSHRPMRAFLTMLGIIIGIGAIVSVYSIGQGGTVEMNKKLHKFGVNRIWIYTGQYRTTDSILKLSDAKLLKNSISDAEYVTASSLKNMYVESGNQALYTQLCCTDASLVKIEDINIKWGRFLSENDVSYAKKTVVIDETLAYKLFLGPTDAIGKNIYILGNSYKIIGVEHGSAVKQSSAKYKAYIPITTYVNYWGNSIVDEITITTADVSKLDAISDEAIAVLGQKYGTDQIFDTYNLAKELSIADGILNLFNSIIISVAIVALVAGGIGIMNIMLVTVSERKQEIGIMKALGASSSQIMLQFLLEAGIIGIMGGVGGILLGVAFSYAFYAFSGVMPVFSIVSLILSALFAIFVGLFFGLYPAYKACKLEPAEALKSI